MNILCTFHVFIMAMVHRKTQLYEVSLDLETNFALHGYAN